MPKTSTCKVNEKQTYDFDDNNKQCTT